jgi:carboxymethylenebutenolidase
VTVRQEGQALPTHDVTLPDGAPACVAMPTGARRGAVVLHEIFGLQPEIRRVVDRFAGSGYAALAPDLFHGGGWKPLCIRRAMKEIAAGEGPMIDRIAGARRWLAQQAGIEAEQIGLIGFCLSGGFALAAGRGWGAVSTNYGPIPPDEVLHGLGPTIGCYGARDRINGKSGPILERKLRALGVEVETHTYPTVGHAFLTDGHHPIAAALSRPLFVVRYDEAVAEDAWSKILTFFNRHL